jgi:hypothetical protein
MKITTQKRFIAEEFPPEPRKWIGGLIQPQNAFNEQVAAALTQGLTFADNLKSRVYSVNVSAGQSWPIKLAYPLNEKPTALIIGNLQENPLEADPSTLPAAMPTFRMGTGTLDITIVGLDALKAYKLTLVAMV